MSRIYDALKKAEQESLARTAPKNTGAGQTQPIAGVTPSGPDVVKAVAISPAGVASRAGVSSAAGPVHPPTETGNGAPCALASTDVFRAEQNQTAAEALPVDFTAKPNGRDTRASEVLHKTSKDKKDDLRVQVFSSTRAELLGAEELRRLRTKLQHIRDKNPIKTVLITSALAGEGKTFLAVNLAQTFTMQHRARVLLIDADLRKPQVHVDLGVPNDLGLSDYLDGRCGLDAIIRNSPVRKLDYILGGTVSSQPAELVGSARFNELIGAVADQFDWIIVDTPPVLPVSDAAVMARRCDAVLLVVAAGHTPGDVAQAAQKELKDANLIGVVLNRATNTASPYKRYYGSYSYTRAQSGDPTAAQ